MGTSTWSRWWRHGSATMILTGGQEKMEKIAERTWVILTEPLALRSQNCSYTRQGAETKVSVGNQWRLFSVFVFFSLKDFLATHQNNSHLKAVIELLSTIEQRLSSQGSAFQCLDVAFLVVGSAVEGTRIQSTNEADCMVFFRQVNYFQEARIWFKVFEQFVLSL